MSPVQQRFAFSKLLRAPTLPKLSSKPDAGDPLLATLRVQILACDALLVGDRDTGSSDPFVEVTFQQQRHKTSVVPKTLEPRWSAKDATFDFPLYQSVADRLGTLLEVVVWDKDLIGKDYLGEMALAADKWFTQNNSHLDFEHAEPFWVDLDLHASRTRNKTASGRVHIKLGFVRPTKDVKTIHTTLAKAGAGSAALFSAPASRGIGTVATGQSVRLGDTEGHGPRFRVNWEGTTLDYAFGSPTAPPPADEGVLLLEIRRASDLPKQKHFARIGWDMDPFVAISNGGNTFRTRVIRHSLNPNWDERLVLASRPGDRIHLRVVDWDRVTRDDHVGDAWLDVDGEGEGLVEQALPLEVDFGKNGYDSKCSPSLLVATRFESHGSLRRRYFAAHLSSSTQYTAESVAAFVTSDIELAPADFRAKLDAIIARRGDHTFGRDEAVDILAELWGPAVDDVTAPSDYETANDRTATPTPTQPSNGHAVAPVDEPEVKPAPVDEPADEPEVEPIEETVPGPDPVVPSEQVSEPEPTRPAPTHVTFEFAGHAHTTWGDHIFVVGDIAELGSWDPARAIALSSATYPVWVGAVALPQDTRFEYKYIRKTPGLPVAWEEQPYVNRVAQTPKLVDATSLRVHDAWYSY